MLHVTTKSTGAYFSRFLRYKTNIFGVLCTIWAMRAITKVINNSYIDDPSNQWLAWIVPVYTKKSCSKNRELRIWSHLLKKSLMENFIFCVLFLYFNPLRSVHSFISMLPDILHHVIWKPQNKGEHWHEMG